MKTPSFLPAIWFLLFPGLPGLAAAITIEPILRLQPSASSSTVGNGDSTAPVISANGRFVAFTSDAGNLVTNDIMRGPQYLWVNVFVRDLATGKTSLASVDSDGVNSGNGHSTAPVISADGRYVAFVSDASNLVPEDQNRATDVFVRDMVLAKTTLISVKQDGAGSGNGSSTDPVMTPDGRFVAFVSSASDLTIADTNGIRDVFVRDAQGSTTTLVSVGARVGTTTLSESRSPSISDDGRFIAYFSTTLGLAAGVGDSSGHVYLRDVFTGTTAWLSPRSSADFPPFSISFNPVISANGRAVAFKMYPPRGITPASLFWYDREMGVTVRVQDGIGFDLLSEPDNYGPILSADGQIVCYLAGQVYVWDAVSRTRTLVSVNRPGLTNAGAVAFAAAMDAAGRRIAFVSAATDLVTNETYGAAQVYVRELATGTTRLASVTQNGVAGLSDVLYPALSADGSKLVFQTDSADLLAGDDNSAADVLVRDLARDTTELVSAKDARLPTVTSSEYSMLHALSADGRHILFTSLASNLVTNENNLMWDLFLVDVITGTIKPAIGKRSNSTSASGPFAPVISPDGRYVAFSTTATNLSRFDTNIAADVYLDDLETGTITLVSINRAGNGPGDRDSTAVAVSADGRYVLFTSLANNLTANPSGVRKLMWRDLSAGQTTQLGGGSASGTLLVSANAQSVVFQDSTSSNLFFRAFGNATNETIGPFPGALLQSLSPDGRWIAFARRANNSSNFSLEVFDRQTRQVRPLATGRAGILAAAAPSSAPAPIFSADSRFLVFSDASSTLIVSDTNNARDVFVVDLEAGRIRLVSINRAATGPGNGASDQPSISADGRFVVFRSAATDLTDDAPGYGSQIFIRDLNAGKTILLSRTPSGQPGNGLSSTPFITPDGDRVVFKSSADNLVTGDFNNATDIFIARIYPSTGDNELRIVPTIQGVDLLRLSWPAQQGKNYRIQYKQSLGDTAWTDLPTPITVQGPAVSATISIKEIRQAFYRVLAMP